MGDNDAMHIASLGGKELTTYPVYIQFTTQVLFCDITEIVNTINVYGKW